jgi:pimeloyl-ACP methyl ester carboxylesterase
MIGRGERERMMTEFLHDVGGYSNDEIDALRETPLWEKRLAVAPSVTRELRAENGFRLDRARLARLRTPTLLLVGSKSPAWARRSTEAYAKAIPGATVRTLEGQGHGASLSAPQLVALELPGRHRFCFTSAVP